ncbi:hypothetical protein WICPIJ_008311 [Wickerhamomyces pijperi]|uniref:Uncharacterized protein n=1 Tax=Wickerhamomyces pijperi TaxID=599730 RepID=A0A9P8PZD1_WICPI|nr:hypothetical protein WICPIJ_008311 [Wickerhamomyces pijperi]
MVCCGLTKTQDTTNTRSDTGVLNVLNGFQSVVVGSGGDDVWIMFPGRVNVMVVGCQPAVFQHFHLLGIDHPQSDTSLHPQFVVNLPNHLSNLL